MQKTAIEFRSAFTDQPLFIEKDEIRIVEGASENNARAKVYTKTKGNFYVKQEPQAINRVVFDKTLEVK